MSVIKALFGKNIEPMCIYCEQGKASRNDKKVLCEFHGVVEPEFSCRHFEYAPLKRKPKVKPVLPEYSAEDFKL